MKEFYLMLIGLTFFGAFMLRLIHEVRDLNRTLGALLTRDDDYRRYVVEKLRTLPDGVVAALGIANVSARRQNQRTGEAP